MTMKLTTTTNVTVDGVMQGLGGPEEDPSGGFERGGWAIPYFDGEAASLVGDVYQRADAFLFGRRTYEIFAASWPLIPTDDDPISAALNGRPKHVASRTLGSVGWSGARLIEGDVAEAVRALRAEDGGELQVHGSPGLVQTLLREDLVDELRLVVAPVTLGRGKRLFEEGTVPRTWRPTASTVTSTGVLGTSYRRAGEVRTGSMGPEYTG